MVPEGTFRHLLDFLVQHEITRADTSMDYHPSRLIGAPIPTIFTPDALPGTTFSIYPSLGQAPNMLPYPVAWFIPGDIL